MVVPTTFETTSFLGNIPKTRILALALLKKRRDEVKRPEKSALWSQYDLEYGEACANVLEQFGYSSNLETNEELQRMILETLEEMKAQKNAPHPAKP